MPTAPIVFASDFGVANEWVGICHAVMSRIAPDSPIVDLSHLIRPLDVVAGAVLLADSLPYMAEDAIVIAVVDPNVGKDRDIAVETGNGRLLVGPDNGLLAPSWRLLGGVGRAIEIISPDVILEPVAPSFHARDVLCPAAAHLANGMPVDELGVAIEPGSLAVVEVPVPEVELGKVRCVVMEYNRFGNITLNVRRENLALARLEGVADLLVEAISGSTQARFGDTYADFGPGEYGVIFDPRGWLTIIRGNPGNALEGLGVTIGDEVWVSGSIAA